MISWPSNNMDYKKIQLESISNNRVLFFEYPRFPIIIDFKYGSINEINLNKILNINDCYIFKIEIISPDKGLFLIEVNYISKFLILNFDTFEYNTYLNNHTPVCYLNSIFTLITKDQIVCGNKYHNVIVYDLNSKKLTSIVKFKILINDDMFTYRISGILLSNLFLALPTKIQGELAIYY